MSVITDDLALRFANALIAHSGNRTQAAISCGYNQGSAARVAGHDLARNPKVLECLDPLLHQQLKSLTPKAITTLSALLNHKSGYIRLEAAKDILDRNGVGTSQAPLQSQPFLIRINLGSTNLPDAAGQVIEHSSLPSQSAVDRPGGRKPEKTEVTSTPTHDFSPEVISTGSIDPGAAQGIVSAEEYDFSLD